MWIEREKLNEEPENKHGCKQFKNVCSQLKNAINTTHKISKSNNQSSFITLDITFHVNLGITQQVCL